MSLGVWPIREGTLHWRRMFVSDVEVEGEVDVKQRKDMTSSPKVLPRIAPSEIKAEQAHSRWVTITSTNQSGDRCWDASKWKK
jgi:hypothetical protein